MAGNLPTCTSRLFSLRCQLRVTSVRLNGPSNSPNNPFHSSLWIEVLARDVAHLICRDRAYSRVVLEQLVQSVAQHPCVQHLAELSSAALLTDRVRADHVLLGARHLLIRDEL